MFLASFDGVAPGTSRCTPAQQAAFDRGGFVAVEPSDRQLYADTPLGLYMLLIRADA